MARVMTSVTGQRLVELRSGLAVLKEKRLPSAEAETLVASIWTMFRPAFDAHDEVVKKLQKESAEAEGLEDEDERSAAFRDVQAKANALSAMRFEVPLAKTKLSSQHMPRAYKGKDGEDNPRGNAGVMIALSPELYQPDAEPEADEADEV